MPRTADTKPQDGLAWRSVFVNQTKRFKAQFELDEVAENYSSALRSVKNGSLITKAKDRWIKDSMFMVLVRPEAEPKLRCQLAAFKMRRRRPRSPGPSSGWAPFSAMGHEPEPIKCEFIKLMNN